MMYLKDLRISTHALFCNMVLIGDQNVDVVTSAELLDCFLPSLSLLWMANGFLRNEYFFTMSYFCSEVLEIIVFGFVGGNKSWSHPCSYNKL